MSTTPGNYGNDFSLPELALTKEDYDRLMKGRTRNLTDGPIQRRRGSEPLSAPADESPAAEAFRKIVES